MAALPEVLTVRMVLKVQGKKKGIGRQPERRAHNAQFAGRYIGS